MSSARAAAAILMAASAVTASAFSTTLGGSCIEVTTARAVSADPQGSEVLVFVRDWQSFGDPWVVELGPDGEIEWASVVGGDLRVSRELESGGCIERLPDGSLLVTAQGEPRATGLDADACVMKIIPGIGTVWADVLGGDDTKVYSISGLAVLEDGSFAVAGNSGPGGWGPFYRLYGSDGEILTSSGLGGRQEVAGAEAAADGLVLLACLDDSLMEPCLIWLRTDGTISRRILPLGERASSGSLYLRGMACADDGRIYLCGQAGGFPWLCCLSAGGTLLWEDVGDVSGSLDGIATGAGGHATCCGRTLGGETEGCALLTQFDESGRQVWERRYVGGDYSSFQGISAVPGAGFLVAGTRYPSGSAGGVSDAWILLTDTLGLVEGCIPEDGVCWPETGQQNLGGPGEGWIVACGVFVTPMEASAAAGRAADASRLAPGILWIPDFLSLSGYEGWLAYLVPVDVDGPEWTGTAVRILESCPDAYLVWIGPTEEHRRRPLFLEN